MTQPADTVRQIPFSVERLDALVRSLTIEERAQLTSGTDAWHAGGVESIGLAPMLTLDGPNGVRGMTLPEGSSATCAPCGTGLGATWDVDLVAEVAARIGLESRRAGIHYLLGPVLNIVRSPLGGRVFECYSEDPMLTAQLGVAYVAGIQSQGVAACPKHFVANDSEAHRTTVNCIVDERTLREVYLLPFEAVARAGAWSMMAAYNLVNGVHCSQNGFFIGSILREEIGWDGVLMSDWHATHNTIDDATAGLDLEMPGPPRFLGDRLAAAVRKGEVEEETLNCAALHVLTLAARVGALPLDQEIDVVAAHEAGDAAKAAPTFAATGAAEAAPAISGAPAAPGAPVLLSDADGAAIVRRAAAESFVLLTNNGILPLNGAKLRKVAVLGPNAATPCTQGGGAAHIDAPYAVSPLDGLRTALPASVKIVHEAGPGIDKFLPPLSRMALADLDGNPGLTVEFFRGQEPTDNPDVRYTVQSSDLHLFGDLPAGIIQNDFSVRISAWATPTASGSHQVAMRGLGGRRLFVDGVLAADEWHEPPGVDVPTALFEGKEQGADFEFEAGKRVLIVGEVHSTTHNPSVLSIGCGPLKTGDEIAPVVAAAAAADVAIVVVGTDASWETEGRDRKTTTLPGRQDELVQRVAAVNKKTIVIVNAGCPMDLPWSDKVAAVIYAWLPGQEFGNALADVLLGIVEPGGRLPVSIAKRAKDFPAYSTTPGANEELVYSEGVNVGYRGFDAAGIEPRFAFGHGLGYTTFKFESLTLAADGLADGEPLELHVKLRNTGKRAGKEVVQVYVADLEASVPRPPRELKGFAVVRLGPGETIDLEMALEDRDLAYWDAARHSWRMEPGRFEVQVGRSSRDIKLKRAFELA
jgi:beta-glucosidase